MTRNYIGQRTIEKLQLDMAYQILGHNRRAPNRAWLSPERKLTIINQAITRLAIKLATDTKTIPAPEAAE